MIRLILTALFLTAGAVQAQEVVDCDWRSSARNLVEPWADNSRTFSNGKVRLAALDTTEPAAGAMHMLVISPPYGELGEPQCKVISKGGSVGFSEISFAELSSDYNPATGLQFIVPVEVYNPDTSGFDPAVLGFTLNQATGEILTVLSE